MVAAIKVVIARSIECVGNEQALRTLAKTVQPLPVTLLSSEPEVQYAFFRNIRLIVQKRPGLLIADVKVFFCKNNDVIYAKAENVYIMVMRPRRK